MRLFRSSTVEEHPAALDLANDADVEHNLKSAVLEHDHVPIPSETQMVIDPEIERRLKRKLDWNLIPLVFVFYLLAFLDRSNIGNAKIAGMATDLKLGAGSRYPWLLTIFYISYILFQFQILAWKRFPPHRWAAFAVFGW